MQVLWLQMRWPSSSLSPLQPVAGGRCSWAVGPNMGLRGRAKGVNLPPTHPAPSCTGSAGRPSRGLWPPVCAPPGVGNTAGEEVSSTGLGFLAGSEKNV